MNNTDNRFDQIDNYDDEIPRHVARYLNSVKTEKNMRSLERFFGQAEEKVVGLDLGCGTGDYMAHLQSLRPAIELHGLDYSEKQLMHARNKGMDNRFIHSSMSNMPMINDHMYDFAYAINSIHHLPSISDQQQTFQEVFRILKPGGIFIIHEINTKNPVIRFYMNYIFPRIRNIDDGSEIWLTETLVRSSSFEIVQQQHFTFVPDFTPAFAMPLMTVIDRYLSATRLSVFGAHVMYVLQKPAAG